jgi:hypothetical protein
VAGVDKDARGGIEDMVRQALGSRVASEAWSVSLVKLAGKWSVTLNGPGDQFRHVSFTAEETRLRDALREVVAHDPGGGAGARAVPGTGSGPSTEIRDHHVCEHCRQAVLVIYESQPDEPKQLAPLACPHCWTIGRVEIGAWAAAGGDYRSEKA